MHRIAGAIGRVGRENLRATLTTARIQGLIQIELTIAPGEIGDAFRREFNRGLGRLVGEEIIRAHGGRLTVSSATDSAVFVRLTLRDGVTAAER